VFTFRQNKLTSRDSRPGVKPKQQSTQCVLKFVPLLTKRPGRKPGHSPPFGVKVTDMYIRTSNNTSVIIARLLIN
jgi:hypothetical protein